MPVPSEMARSFITFMPSLAPGADAAELVAFFHEHRETLTSAVGELPGHDRLRAGLVRLLPALGLEEDERAMWLAAAEAAMEAYVPEEQDAADALRRPPAWVALCMLELEELKGSDGDAALARALSTAVQGFKAPGDQAASGEGEALWAMAEAAAEVSWMDRADPLMEAAASAPFEDPHNHGRVLLIRILRLLDLDQLGDVDAQVETLLALDELHSQTRVHALWIGALRDREASNVGRAITRLQEAEALVEEEPEVLGRIRQALSALGVRDEGAAEA